MSEKLFDTRIQSKNDTEANWNQATSFVPKRGEIIVYNPDDNNPTARIKVGDGVTAVTGLPFIYEFERIVADDDGVGNVYLTLHGLDVDYSTDASTVIIA